MIEMIRPPPPRDPVCDSRIEAIRGLKRFGPAPPNDKFVGVNDSQIETIRPPPPRADFNNSWIAATRGFKQLLCVSNDKCVGD
mmetsp:Transcript_34486/g.46609  ORF Transcript_34486/g.46609 Transcript_34486/m.46609 type:complete len:83 (-) Transcript_34486:210-458(-)